MKKAVIPVIPVVLVLAVSCSSPRYIYSPAPPNIPYFTDKGQSKLTAYYSSGGGDANTREKNNGFDLQGAYAPGHNWAVMASYMYRGERDFLGHYYNFFDSSVINYKRNLAEAGTGYFVSLNKKGTIFFALYGGLGKGKFSFTDKGKDKSGTLYERKHDARVTKVFFQPSFNFIPGRYFQFALVGRSSFVWYGHISTSYTPDELAYFGLDMLPQKAWGFFEPTLNIRIGIPDCDWIKIDGGFTASSDPPGYYRNIEARNFNASIGVTIDLPVRKK